MEERETIEPWELGGDWWRDFDWASLDTHELPQGGGRALKYARPGVMRTILEHVVNGLPISSAARLAGVGQSTIYEWRESVPAVREALKAAEAALQAEMLRHIKTAALTQWAAGMTLLERRFPEEFGRRDRVRHEHAGTVGLQLQPGRMDSKSILLAAELEERMSQDERKALPEHDFSDSEQT